jgi:hypothetical protein
MPSVKNPNTISKNRQADRAGKQRKASKQAASQSKLNARGGIQAKADARRGARPGLLPTSGPRAPISKKKMRKLEKAMGHALRRKMEAEGEVVMKGTFCSVVVFLGLGTGRGRGGCYTLLWVLTRL